MYDIGLINGEIFVEGQFLKKNIYIFSEKISMISDSLEPAHQLVDCQGLKILPGFIDPHVHMALDLGEFSSVDDFESGTMAAAYGGITTILDFLDPIDCVAEFETVFDRRLQQAKNACIDYSFHLTLGNYKELKEIPDLLKSAYSHGLSSVKIFTTYSESDRKCHDDVIAAVLKSPMLLMAHSENDELVDAAYDDVASFESSRPVMAEISEVAKLAELAAFTKGHLYVVHTSAGSTVEMVAERFGDNLKTNIFLESCPQYFYLTKEYFKGMNGRKYLLAPPLRSSEEQRTLRSSLHRLSTIGTDHCPFMSHEKMKYKGASKVPKGIGGIEYSFLLMYNLYGDEIIAHYTSAPASIFGLTEKGTIDYGKDADLVILDPNKTTVVDSGHSACDYSPYAGKELKGQIHSTIVRGRFVMKDRTFCGGTGQFVRREYCESTY